MCGINGIFAYHYASRPIDQNELSRSRDYMAARGPDSFGSWISDDCRVGLGHRRLSIIDVTDSGAQPMASADGSLVVSFNGEIYNYRELRSGLEAKGYVFRSRSDTEVLLYLYADKGPEMVHDLRGMFAFAIWDAKSRKLFIARDPLGIKPLYYADDGWTFRFASQVKALQAGGAISSDPDPAGCVGFYLWGSVPEPYTHLRDVRSLPAGCHMVIDRVGTHSPRRFHSVASVYCEAERLGRTVAEPQAVFREALLDSVRHHLVADVPVGVFLSSGIDSGALVGLMRDANHAQTSSVTISFDEFRGTEQDESKFAGEVSRLYGTRHTNYVVTRSEFEEDLPRIMTAMDLPSIDGINSWFVSKAAARLGLKVAISGLGGDELLGGYPSFQDIPRWVKRFAIPSSIPGAGLAFRKLVTSTMAGWNDLSPKAAGMVSLGGTYPGAYLLRRGLFMPWELDRLLPPEMVKEGLKRLGAFGGAELALVPAPGLGFAKVAALETQLYMRNQLLRDADWASMAHGLEVRVPLVDATLLGIVAPLVLSGGITSGKHALAMAPSTPLPTTVVRRLKTGFSTPIADWQLRHAGLAGIPTTGNAGRAVHSALPWARRWAVHVGKAMGLADGATV